MLFFDKFVHMCKINHVAPTKVIEEIGLNKSNYTFWKEGSIPRSPTIAKLANYFNVAPSFFIDGNIGKTERYAHPSESSRGGFWFYNFENKLKENGYSIDFLEDDSYMWIVYPSGTLEVQISQLKDLNTELNSFLRFKLEELKNDNISDFSPNERKNPKYTTPDEARTTSEQREKEE